MHSVHESQRNKILNMKEKKIYPIKCLKISFSQAFASQAFFFLFVLLLPLWMDAVQKSISKKSLRKERSESKGNRACLNIFLLNLNRSFAVSCAQLGVFFFCFLAALLCTIFIWKTRRIRRFFFLPAPSRSFEFNSEWTWVSFRSYIPKAHAEWPSNYLIKLPCSASNIFYFTFCYTNLPSVWWMSGIFCCATFRH